MPREIRSVEFPVKLDDNYTCQGREMPDGPFVVFDDLLKEGDTVAKHSDGEGNLWGPFGVVVRRDDGLWVIAELASRGRVAIAYVHGRAWRRSPRPRARRDASVGSVLLVDAMRGGATHTTGTCGPGCGCLDGQYCCEQAWPSSESGAVRECPWCNALVRTLKHGQLASHTWEVDFDRERDVPIMGRCVGSGTTLADALGAGYQPRRYRA